MALEDILTERGYEFTGANTQFLKYRKRDENNVSDVIMIFDISTKTFTSGIVPVRPIYNIDDISHQYKIFRDMEKDIKYFSEELEYEKI